MTLFTPFPWIGLGHLYHVFVYNVNNYNLLELLIELKLTLMKFNVRLGS